MIEVEQNQQPDRYEPICEDGQKIVRGIIALAHRLHDVTVSRAYHEERPPKCRRKPERAAYPKAQEAQQSPSAIVKPNLKLEGASRRPTDKLCCLVGKEDVRNEPEY